MQNCETLRIELKRLVQWYESIEEQAGAGLNPTQIRALDILATRAGSSNKELTKELGLTESATSRLLERLKSMGLVSRQQGHDTKETWNCMTAAGKERFLNIRRNIEQRLHRAIKEDPSLENVPIVAALEGFRKADKRAQEEAARAERNARRANIDPDFPL